MSYSGISIKELLSKINSNDSGWYLPQVQRQYVWGDRHQSETYICLLLDSLLKGYPIGGVVLWETKKEIPYREFLRDYEPNKYNKQLEEGNWGKHKFLVYDGQQRLQTLYSVLKYSFNNKSLYFDLLFDDKASETDETGFLFIDREGKNKKKSREARYLDMIKLCSYEDDEDKVKLRIEVEALYKDNPEKRILVERNIENLWRIFVNSDIKSIAFFSVKSNSEQTVNEVFRRLNTGGVSLTEIELVLGKIKADNPSYEEDLWKLSENIKEKSHGIEFSAESILQLLHLLIKGTTRIDSSRITDEDIKLFESELENIKEPLIDFFKYLEDKFGINNSRIIPRWLSILPILSYLVQRDKSNLEYKMLKISEENLRKIKQYFLLSQFCDWNTQTMVNQFSKLAKESIEKGDGTFPLDEIRKFAKEKNRNENIKEIDLFSQRFLALKLIFPRIKFNFYGNKPQVDHIFPLALQGITDENYRKDVDVLWNFQPISGDINNLKRAKHPKEFFLSDEGKEHLKHYDSIPELESELWNSHTDFIKYRKDRMLEKFQELYNLKIEQ